MEFSLFYFAADSDREPDGPGGPGGYRLLLDGARFADDHDFTAVWTPERHFHPFGGLYPNPAVTSAAVAAVTSRIGVRAGSVVLPLHHPVRLAEDWAVVDRLSGGRAGMSLASGANPVDFLLGSADYGRRREQTLHGVEVLRRLWAGEPYHDTDRDVSVSIRPRPVRPALPLWLTCGGSERTFVEAGAVGLCVLTHLMNQSQEALRAHIEQYRRAFRPAAPGDSPHVTLMVHTFVGGSDAEAHRIAGGPLERYLVSAMNLFAGTTRPDDARARLAVRSAVARYCGDDGLIGSVDTCAASVERFAALGVDELACLIDFGVEDAEVLDALPRLDVVRRRSSLVGAR